MDLAVVPSDDCLPPPPPPSSPLPPATASGGRQRRGAPGAADGGSPRKPSEPFASNVIELALLKARESCAQGPATIVRGKHCELAKWPLAGPVSSRPTRNSAQSSSASLHNNNNNNRNTNCNGNLSSWPRLPAIAFSMADCHGGGHASQHSARREHSDRNLWWLFQGILTIASGPARAVRASRWFGKWREILKEERAYMMYARRSISGEGSQPGAQCCLSLPVLG